MGMAQGPLRQRKPRHSGFALGRDTSSIPEVMRSPFRPLRSRFFRLLASVLVVASLLGNGLAMAQSSAMPVKKDCCAGMMDHMKHAGGCHDGGKPCPSPNAGCDEQCLSRCQSSSLLPTIALMLPGSDLVLPALPSLSIGERPLTDPGPGLRPPISA